MAHIHDVIDDDRHFIIDPDTRTIKFAGETIPTLIQFDHNSERFTFEIPRGVESHDMTLCNKIQVHFININKDNPNECYPSIYEVPKDDIITTGDDDGTLLFTWLIDQSATLLAGPLNFAVRFMCTSEHEVENEEGETVTEVVLDYSLNTHPHEGVVVSSGMDNNETLSNTYYEVVDQWYSTITAYGESAKNDAITAINEAKTIALDNIEQSFDHLDETEQDAISAITNAQGSAVKLIQKTETAAIDNIDEHAESAMENWSNTNAGKDILSQVTALREEVANLANNTTLCKPGVLYGEHKNSSYNNRFMNGHGKNYKSAYLIGESGGPFIISHDYGAKISSIKQVLLVNVIGASGDTQLENVEFEWLNPVFESDIPSGVIASYSSGVGYIDEEDNTFYQDIGMKTVEYPTESVFVIEPGTPYITYKDSKFDSKTGYLTIEFVSPIFLGDKRWRAVRYAACKDIEWIDEDQDLSTVSDVEIQASYLIITAPDNINFAIRQCSSGTSEFTVNANGIAAIEGPIENNLEDTYTIILDDGTTKSFTVPNGNSAGIRTKVSGEIVRCDDVIDVEHTVKVTARSRNLAPCNLNYHTLTANGVQFIYNTQDGTVWASGTATDTAYFIMQNGTNYSDGIPIKKGKYTIGLAPAIGCRVVVGLHESESANRVLYSASHESTASFEVTTNTARFDMILCVDKGYTANNALFEPILVRSGDSLDYVPYVDVDGAILTRIGKNMIPYPHAYGTGTIAGVTYTANSDGSVIATGTATADSIQYLISQYTTLPPGTYTLSGCPAGGSSSTYRLCIKTSHTTPMYYHDVGNGCTFTIDEYIGVQVYIYIANGVTANNLFFKPQLEVGSIATEFESYVTGVEYETNSKGEIYAPSRIRSISPTMTLLCDQNGVVIDAEYNVDQTAAYNKISALLTTLLNGGS